MAQDIRFRGVGAPLRLHGAEPVLDLLPMVITRWPYEVRDADPSAAPFFSIRAEPGSDLFLCETHIGDREPRRLDALNVLCDMAATLALAWPATDDSLICLHAAAVNIGGRLVVFPSIRRAGKSTLSAALARAGHPVFSDDVLPVSFDADGHALGHAMGIAPRLRLPLPEMLPQGFRDWVARTPGPGNGQYRYLHTDTQPANGSTLPVGAFVILDRQDGPVPTRLEPVTPDAAMDVLLHQNFTRDRHSADILRLIAATLTGVPTMRLTYSDLTGALTCLKATFDHWPDSLPPAKAGPALHFRMADFDSPLPEAPPRGAPLIRRAGAEACTIGEKLYLSDPEGRAIHRTDPLSAAIWDVLAEPVTQAELEAMIAEAFPGTPHDRIAGDLERLLGELAGAGLIEAGRRR